MKKKRYLQRTRRRRALTTITVIAAVTISLFMHPVPVSADAPIESLRISIDKITTVLDDKAFRESHSREELNKKLIEVAQDRFNWEEIA